MCGGSYSAWDTPRQLLPVRGEPIVARTIRLLRESGADDIAISTNDERFEALGVPILRHDNDMRVEGEAVIGCWANAFYPTEEPACYLMGDVIYSPEAIDKIVKTPTDSIRFFASAPPFALKYIKNWAEPFAFKVEDQRRFRAAVAFVIANAETGIFRRPPIAWELWQVIRGKDVREIDYHSYDVINDYTCDVDYPSDIGQIERFV